MTESTTNSQQISEYNKIVEGFFKSLKESIDSQLEQQKEWQKKWEGLEGEQQELLGQLM